MHSFLSGTSSFVFCIHQRKNGRHTHQEICRQVSFGWLLCSGLWRWPFPMVVNTQSTDVMVAMHRQSLLCSNRKEILWGTVSVKFSDIKTLFEVAEVVQTVPGGGRFWQCWGRIFGRPEVLLWHTPHFNFAAQIQGHSCTGWKYTSPESKW